MNDKFLTFLKHNSWQIRIMSDHPRYPTTDYLKPYSIHLGNETIPVLVSATFSWENNDGFPQRALLKFVDKSEVVPSRSNRTLLIKGTDRIIATLEHAGLVMAIKCIMYGNSIKYFKKQSKEVLEIANQLPT